MENGSLDVASCLGYWEMAGSWKADRGGDLYPHTQYLYSNHGHSTD